MTDDPMIAVALATEVLAWLALPVGIVLVVVGLARRAWAARYEPVQAVITNVREREAKLRWFSQGAEVHESSSPLTGPIPAVGDGRTVWVHPSRPESPRLDDPSHDGRALLLLGGILGGIGLLAAIASFLLPLL